MLENYYCKLFLNTSLPRKELIEKVRSRTNDTISGYFINCGWASMDVRLNDEYSKSMKNSSGRDSFLYCKYIINIDKEDAIVSDDIYINSVRDLVKFFRSDFMTVVAACDFEDQL